MPAGSTITWVNQRHDTYPQYATGWQFVADADLTALSTAKTIDDMKAVPARYLTPRTPGLFDSTP